jgi:hypothetical protein
MFAAQTAMRKVVRVLPVPGIRLLPLPDAPAGVGPTAGQFQMVLDGIDFDRIQCF